MYSQNPPAKQETSKPSKEVQEQIERARNLAKEKELQNKWNKDGLAREAAMQKAFEQDRAFQQAAAAQMAEALQAADNNGRIAVQRWQQGAFPAMTREAMRQSFFTSVGGSEQAFKQQKRDKIRRELDRLNTICDLTPAQLKKIEDAIEIDMDQLHIQIEKIMSEFDPDMDINQFSRMQQEIRRLSTNANATGVSKEDFWLKVFNSQLTTPQKTLLEQDRMSVANNKMRTHHYRTLLGFQRKFGLTQEQRKAALEWISQENRQRVPYAEIEKQYLASPAAEMLTDEQKRVARPPTNFRNQ